MEKLTNKRHFIREEAQKLLCIRGINKRIRRLRPWNWHRTFRHRVPVDQLLFTHFIRKEEYALSNFGKLAHMGEEDKEAPFWVCSITSVDWKNIKSTGNTRESGTLYDYMCYLEYLIKILPKAEPYTPLIDLCKAKAFSPMSIALPDLSRRARSVIADYLERVEYEVRKTKVRARTMISNINTPVRAAVNSPFLPNSTNFQRRQASSRASTVIHEAVYIVDQNGLLHLPGNFMGGSS